MSTINRSSLKHKKRSVLTDYENNKPASLERQEPSRLEKQKILIYCEGENTEPSYFRKFRLSSATIESFGQGRNTRSLVERAIELKANGDYNQVWCVFDADDHGVDNFNAAIRLAEKNDIGVAYSIQAFEYWLILHFEDHQGGGMHRNEYNAKINSYTSPFDVAYDGNGNKLVGKDLFDLLMGSPDGARQSRVKLAIRRAKKNYGNFDHRSPGTEESSTTVFRLVEEILKFE